jgi:hypothetical protein
MPSVIDPALMVIFCEGRPGSLDDLLLSHILPIGGALIKPVGGKRGMRAFIEGHLTSYSEASRPAYLGFRDRDFDVEPPGHPELIRLRGEKTIWLTHRAAIENYFIDADLIWQYWAEREDAPKWAHGPALSVTEIEGHIRASARELVDYQAVRWALSRLKPGPRWPEIRATWTTGSGDIPASLGYDDCLNQACRLITDFQTQIENVHSRRLRSKAQAYRDQFSADRFFEKHGYLTWFHGKDHLVQLCRRLAPNFPRGPYARWAAQHVDVHKHPDLQQLINWIEGVA